MAGPLKINPYLKTYDEVQRSAGRMKTYLDINFELIPDDEKESILILIEALEKALRYIPEKYRVTQHFQYKDKK